MYVYENLRPKIFTEEGQVMFLGIRDNVKKLLKQAGAVRMQEAMNSQTGDTWLKLACVDRLVELGEIREVVQPEAFEQHRIFVATNH